jgi:hypothetical protein
LLAVGVVVSIGIRQMKGAREAWSRAATSLGMTAQVGGVFSRPVITGRLGAFNAEIDTFTQRSGNSSTTYTRYRVFYPSLGVGLELKPQHALHRITKFFGAQDVEVGDGGFDDALIVKADDPGAVLSLLTAATRTSLLRLFSSQQRTTVDDTKITIVTRGLERSEDTLVSTIRRAAAVARRLTGLDDSAGIDELLERRLAGELSEVADRVRGVVRPHPDDLDGRILEMETLATAGRREEATKALEELEAVLPADPEVAGWRGYLDTPPPPEPATAEAIDADRFFESLFAGAQMSYETTALFDRHYRGRPVRWEGRVKDVRRYDRDLDFGPAPGTKVVVTMATIEHDLYGQTAIDAVVQLPTNATVHEGDTISFSGVLMRVDPLMRNVYVGGGRLV